MPTCFYRSTLNQVTRYAQGRTTSGKIVTYCDGYIKVSKHQKWRAFDFVVVKKGMLIWKHIQEYDKLGAFWERIGGKWGGRWSFVDIYHFEDKA